MNRFLTIYNKVIENKEIIVRVFYKFINMLARFVDILSLCKKITFCIVLSDRHTFSL
jgi:hypothetical protein